MIARQRRLPEAARARRSSTTPSTSSTASAPIRDYALRAVKAAADGGRRLDRAVRHQRRQPARAGSPRSWARCARAIPTPARHPHPQRRRARGGQRAGRGRGRLHAGAGHDQRLRRALRQRQPDLDHPGPAAQDGPALRARREPGAPDRAVARGQRDRQHPPATRTRPTWASPRSRTRAACTSPRSRRWPRATSTSRPSGWATGATSSSPSCRAAATCACARGELGVDAQGERDGGARPRSRSSRTRATSSRRPRARSSCWCGAAAPATSPPFEVLDVVVIAERRRGKRDVRRGDGQAEGRRRDRPHRRRGRRARCTRSTARLRKALEPHYPRAARRPPGRLQGPHPRPRGGHRRQDARADRGRARRGALEHDRRVAEHHRGQRGRRWPTASSCTCCGSGTKQPLRLHRRPSWQRPNSGPPPCAHRPPRRGPNQRGCPFPLSKMSGRW